MTWWDALFARRPIGVRLGLEIVGAVYRCLGAPGGSVPAVHVVGTNGKGSTAAACAHALQQHGFHVGRYTSPHLHRVVERVAVDGVPVEEAELRDAVARVTAIEAKVPLPRPLSFFEVLTLAALVVFEARDLDVLVVEAGLGGRLDATRLVTPVVHAVTAIARDHEQYLGSSLAAIAQEKAAVFTRGVPIRSVEQVGEVAEVLNRSAAQVGNRVQWVEPLRRDTVGLVGEHQRVNAALALAAARVLAPSIADVDLDGVHWPGRLEMVAWGQARLLFDVAHNPHGMDALVNHLRREVPDLTAIVVGLLADKPASPMLASLRRVGVPLLYIPPPAEGAQKGVDGVDLSFTGVDDPAFTGLWTKWRTMSGTVCVCGSHRLVGPLRARTLGLREASQPGDPLDRAGSFGQPVPSR